MRAWSQAARPEVNARLIRPSADFAGGPEKIPPLTGIFRFKPVESKLGKGVSPFSCHGSPNKRRNFLAKEPSANCPSLLLFNELIEAFCIHALTEP